MIKEWLKAVLFSKKAVSTNCKENVKPKNFATLKKSGIIKSNVLQSGNP